MQLLWATTTPAATVRRGRVPPPSFYCDNIDNFGPQVRSLYHDGHQFPQLLRPQPSVLGHRPQQDLPLRALQVPVLGEGQVRLAQLQAMRAIQLARMEIKEAESGKGGSLIGTDSDASFFKLLSATDSRQLPSIPALPTD